MWGRQYNKIRLYIQNKTDTVSLFKGGIILHCQMITFSFNVNFSVNASFPYPRGNSKFRLDSVATSSMQSGSDEIICFEYWSMICISPCYDTIKTHALWDNGCIAVLYFLKHPTGMSLYDQVTNQGGRNVKFDYLVLINWPFQRQFPWIRRMWA